MALKIPGATALAGAGAVRLKVGHKLPHVIAIGVKDRIGRADLRIEGVHRHQRAGGRERARSGIGLVSQKRFRRTVGRACGRAA
jgi:hypothetical protein